MAFKVCEFWPKNKIRLLNIPTDSRYRVILIDISKHLSTLLKEVVSYKKIYFIIL